VIAQLTALLTHYLGYWLLLQFRAITDYICCLYGTPSAYGVVTMPFSVREGINVFLAGFVPTENLRFRDEELDFKMATSQGRYIL
jgi:translation initiation factor RLI1